MWKNFNFQYFFKGKLDVYREDDRKGKELNPDQKAAIAKYDEVMQNLEFARDLQIQFRNFSADEERAKKKQSKKEALERAKTETSRLALILVLQKITSAFSNNKVKEDFTNGEHGAIKLTKEQLNQIDDFLKLIKNAGLDETDKVYVSSAEHLMSLAEAKPKKFNGKATYKDLLDVFTAIKKSAYDFDQQTQTTTTTSTNTNSNTTSPNKPTTPKKSAPLTNGKPEPSPVKEIPPAVPQPTGGVAAAPIPNVATATPPVFPAPPHMFPAPSTTQQPSINFLQESQIDMESPHMDPAVVMVQHSAHPPPTTTAPPPFVGKFNY